MVTEYIEIIHVERLLNEFGKGGPRQKAVADRIFQLEQTAGVTYENGFLDTDPCLPKDTPIRLGGGSWEFCVQYRAHNLRKMGYTNVRADRQISFSSEDAYLDLGLL